MKTPAIENLVPIPEVWHRMAFVETRLVEVTTSSNEFLSGIGEHYAGFPYGEATQRYRYSAILNCNWKVSLYVVQGDCTCTIENPLWFMP